MIFIVAAIISLVTQGNIWLPLMLLLGGTIGIPMALSYPWEGTIKILIIIGLTASILATTYGFINSKKNHGQVLAVVGIILWLIIGTIYGLGTGT